MPASTHFSWNMSRASRCLLLCMGLFCDFLVKPGDSRRRRRITRLWFRVLVAAASLTVVIDIIGARRGIRQFAAFARIDREPGNAVAQIPGGWRRGLVAAAAPVILPAELAAVAAAILAAVLAVALTAVLHVDLGPRRRADRDRRRDRQHTEQLHLHD